MDVNVDDSMGRPLDFEDITVHAGSIQAHHGPSIQPVPYVCSGAINGNPIELLLDSGCPASIIDVTQYYALPPGQRPDLLSSPYGSPCTSENPARLTYTGLGGASKPSLGCGVFDISIEGVNARQWLWVVDMEGLPRGAILGVDFQEAYDVMIQMAQKRAWVQGVEVPLHASTWDGGEVPVRCYASTVVQPDSAALITVSLGGRRMVAGADYLVKPLFDLLDKTGLLLAHCVVNPDGQGMARLAVTNTTGEDLYVAKNQLLAIAMETESVATLHSNTDYARDFPELDDLRDVPLDTVPSVPDVVPVANVQTTPVASTMKATGPRLTLLEDEEPVPVVVHDSQTLDRRGLPEGGRAGLGGGAANESDRGGNQGHGDEARAHQAVLPLETDEAFFDHRMGHRLGSMRGKTG